MQEMGWFFRSDKESCKKARMLVTLITRLLIGITFMQVLGGAYSSRKVQQGSIAVILRFAESLIVSKNGAAWMQSRRVGNILCAVIRFCLQFAFVLHGESYQISIVRKHSTVFKRLEIWSISLISCSLVAGISLICLYFLKNSVNRK